MNGQSGVLAQMLHPGKTHPIDTDHDTRATGSRHSVALAQHVIDRARHIEGIHRHAPQPVGMAMQHRHHRRQPRSKRLVGRIGHQLIVLDEINPRCAQRIDQLSRLIGTQTNAGFDDRAHQGTPVHARQLARALDAKRRSLKLGGIGG